MERQGVCVPGWSHLLGPFLPLLSCQEARLQPRLWGGTGAAFTFQKAKVAPHTAEEWVGRLYLPRQARKGAAPARPRRKCTWLSGCTSKSVPCGGHSREGCRPGQAGAVGCWCLGTQLTVCSSPVIMSPWSVQVDSVPMCARSLASLAVSGC